MDVPVFCIEGSFVLSNTRIYIDDRVHITVWHLIARFMEKLEQFIHFTVIFTKCHSLFYFLLYVGGKTLD